jgi:hypothetical protein
MLNQVFPRYFDNAYRGHRLALWLFGAILLMKTAIALGTIFNGRTAAQTADGIPLDSFGVAGAAAVVSLFAIWGLAQFVISLIGVLALVRYRAMVPLMLALFLFEHVARRVIFLVMPIPRDGTAPGLYINFALLAVMTVGLALSLQKRADGSWPQ